MFPAPLVGNGPWTIPPTVPGDERARLVAQIARRNAADPMVEREAARLAAELTPSQKRDARTRERALAEAALAFVQGLPWKDGPEGIERYQSARVTLQGGGNCHDLSLLLVALLEALGVHAKPTWDEQPGAALNHMLVQVFLDDAWCAAGKCHPGWCWAETTVPGARICEDPYAAQGRLGGRSGFAALTVAPMARLPQPTGQDAVVMLANATAAPDRHTAHAAQAPVRGVGSHTARTVSPSKGLDPCASALNRFHAIRANGNRSLRMVSTPSYAQLRTRDGEQLYVAGLPVGLSCLQWRSMPLDDRARALALALGPLLGQVDSGVYQDWQNVQLVELSAECDAWSTELEAARADVVRCLRANGVDGAAMLARLAISCEAWQRLAPAARRAAVRGYVLAPFPLDDTTLDAIGARVDRACVFASRARGARATVARAPVARAPFLRGGK